MPMAEARKSIGDRNGKHYFAGRPHLTPLPESPLEQIRNLGSGIEKSGRFVFGVTFMNEIVVKHFNSPCTARRVTRSVEFQTRQRRLAHPVGRFKIWIIQI